MAERALADLLSDPNPLWHVSAAEREAVWILFVSLGSLQLAPNLGNARFQIRLRYGGHGRFREKFSQKVKSTPPVSLQGQPSSLQGMLVQLHDLENNPELNGSLGVCESFDSVRDRWIIRMMNGEAKAIRPQNLTPSSQVFANMDSLFVFPWSRDLPPHITFSVRKLGFYDTTISEATVHIPFEEGRPGMAEQELLFLGKRGITGFVGQLGISAELRCFARSELVDGPCLPSSLEQMLGSLELLRMPPGHLGPNSMAGSPETGIPLEHQGLPPGAMRFDLHGMAAAASGYAGGLPANQSGTPVVIGRPVPGTGWTLH